MRQSSAALGHPAPQKARENRPFYSTSRPIALAAQTDINPAQLLPRPQRKPATFVPAHALAT
jgi:hypothetical protein